MFRPQHVLNMLDDDLMLIVVILSPGEDVIIVSKYILYRRPNCIKHSTLCLSCYCVFISDLSNTLFTFFFCLFDSFIIRRTTRIRIAKYLAEVDLKYFTQFVITKDMLAGSSRVGVIGMWS